MPPKKRNDEEPSSTDVLLKEILSTVRENKQTLSENCKKLEELETKFSNLSTVVSNLEKRVDIVEGKGDVTANTCDQLYNAMRTMEIINIRNEENSRRFNVIAYNVPQSSDHESRETSITKVHEILADVFRLDNPNGINVCEAHRLPNKSGKGRKPLIFKLTSMVHKDILWRHISNAKLYNDAVTENERISINMTHLPAKLSKDKEDLKEKFDEAKVAGKKPKWRYIKSTGQYCLKIGDKLIKSPNDNFTCKIQ